MSEHMPAKGGAIVPRRTYVRVRSTYAHLRHDRKPVIVHELRVELKWNRI
jgi:hypothetical protein